MRNPPRSSLTITAALAALVTGALTVPTVRAFAEDKEGSIQIEYEAPKDPAMKDTYDLAKGARGLEMMQVVFSSFRLPENLYMKLVNCDGIPNAYFFREDDRPTIRICYEYLHSVYEMMPKEPTAEGVTPREAFTGQLLFAIAHEFGHAVFDIYNLPVLGRQEDAADQFATHFLLHFGGQLAQRLIWGAAYSYNGFLKNLKDKPKVTVPITAFASDHGAPEQRFYNLLCLAYGYDAKIFADVVMNEYLPKSRARNCRYEYVILRYAFKQLIVPHLDMDMAKQVMDSKWLDDTDKRPMALR